MIVNQDKSQANIIGEVQSNKVDIDINNINFITSLLTSNLYSKPIQSFLRETVANAWDSQVEAGNINTPILIKIDNINEDDLEIAVRDYGTGLSPERFNEIYKNIGSSTKRESNDFIGMMGIGRFAALSVNDTVSIKSYYNRKLYNYLMYKDGESLNIDLLNVSDTEFDNGVEVKVTVKDGYYKHTDIKEGLAALAYFEQIYISTNIDYLDDFANRFNKRTIHEFDNFKVCSLKEIKGLHFLMGNVLYKDNDNTLIEFKNNPSIAIKCFIGEADITPNRESLRFSDRTKTVLDYKLKAANEEIYDKAKEMLNQDFSTIESWNNAINNENLYVELWYFKDEDYRVRVAITPTQKQDKNLIANCTIRGKEIPKDLARHYFLISNMTLPYHLVTYVYSNLQFCKSKRISLKELKNNSCNVYKIKDSFKQSTKAYLREYFGYCKLYFIREESFESAYKELFGNYIKWLKAQHLVFSKHTFILIIEEFYEAFKNFKSFNNSDVPKDWLDSTKEEKAKTKRRDFVIHTLYYGRQGITTNTQYTLKDLLSCNLTIVYDEINSEYLRNIYKIFNNLSLCGNYTFIEVSKSNIPVLQKYKRFININDFTTKFQRSLSKVFTGFYIKENFKCPYCDYPLRDDYFTIINTYRKYVTYNLIYVSSDKDFKELYDYYVSKKWLDWSVINTFDNPDIYMLSDFCNELQLKSYSDVYLTKVALSYFIYKHNIKIGNLNKRTAYEFLKTI